MNGDIPGWVLVLGLGMATIKMIIICLTIEDSTHREED